MLLVVQLITSLLCRFNLSFNMRAHYVCAENLEKDLLTALSLPEPKSTEQGAFKELAEALQDRRNRAIHAYYLETGSPKRTAAKFGISVNTVKARARRSSWCHS